MLKIKGSGCRIIIYTESLSYYSFYRLKRLGLDGVVDAIYTPPDHELPQGAAKLSLRHYDPSFYSLRYAKQCHTPLGELKPNPDILMQIIRDAGCSADNALYIGDSRHKDIAMAKDAGVASAWAKYGETPDNPAYDLLRSVTHWTDEDVEREREVRAREVVADVVLTSNFGEILEHFSFGEATT